MSLCNDKAACSSDRFQWPRAHTPAPRGRTSGGGDWRLPLVHLTS